MEYTNYAVAIISGVGEMTSFAIGVVRLILYSEVLLWLKDIFSKFIGINERAFLRETRFI